MSFSRELPTQNTQAMSPQQIKDMCQKNLYQLVQFETTEGNRYAGILHSYDQDQMYVIMPIGNQTSQQQSSDNRLFSIFWSLRFIWFSFLRTQLVRTLLSLLVVRIA